MERLMNEYYGARLLDDLTAVRPVEKIALRAAVKPERRDKVRSYFNASVFNGSDEKEFRAWGKYDASLADQSDATILFEDVLLKANFIKTFRLLMPKLELSGSEKVLEMGAGCGWASVLVKHRFPDAYVVASDLTPASIKHAERWERTLGVDLNEKWAFSSRDIPFESAQFDRVFTFAAFHHFGDAGDFTKSLAEMVRVTKSGGKVLLLYEPSSPRYLYNYAFKRAIRIRLGDEIDEDVLVLARIRAAARSLGCRCEVEPFPCSQYRDSAAASVYYSFLAKLGPLWRLFVCTVNICIEKP